MKKLFPFLLAVLMFSSCIDSNSITITISNTITETVAVDIPQTNGIPHTTNETVNQNLDDIIVNLDDVDSINIDALSYQFKNVNGNSAAIIQNATLAVNGVTIATHTNLNVSQEATNGTVFTISDEVVLNQLETLILNNSTVTVQYSSSTLSDAGPITFDVEVSVDLTATLK